MVLISVEDFVWSCFHTLLNTFMDPVAHYGLLGFIFRSQETSLPCVSTKSKPSCIREWDIFCHEVKCPGWYVAELWQMFFPQCSPPHYNSAQPPLWSAHMVSASRRAWMTQSEGGKNELHMCGADLGSTETFGGASWWALIKRVPLNPVFVCHETWRALPDTFLHSAWPFFL